MQPKSNTEKKMGNRIFRAILATKCIKSVAAGILVFSSFGLSAQQVSLKFKNASLEEVIRELRKQTGYDFAYSPDLAKSFKPVNIDVKDKPLKEVLESCCIEQPVTYTLSDRTIVFKRRAVQRTTHVQQTVEEQQYVKGRVLDEKGEGLPGVTIRVANVENQFQTNKDGYFSIPGTTSLMASITMVGYSGKIANLLPNVENKITLKVENQELDEMVVVGYGKTKKENLTTAVSTITSEEITQMPTTNLSQVFAGRLPGLLSRTTSGTPGADNATLLIRTTSGTQAPLLVIDGVPRNINGNDQAGLQEIDPNEVESISVLKDNAAGAVYGSRAANGVIIITTKRGKIGKPSFSYTNNTSWTKPGRMISTIDGHTYALFQNEIALNNGLPAPYSPAVLDTIQNQWAPHKYANTDWIDLLTGTSALVQNHSMNINGGSEAVRYFVSGSYTDQNGMYAGNGYKRYTLQSNLDFKLSDQLKAEVNISYRGGRQDVRGASALNSAVNSSPLTPVYMLDGTFGVGTGGGSNPMADISDRAGYRYNKDNFMTMIGKLTWESKMVRGLGAYTSIAVDKNFTRTKDYSVPVPLYQWDPTSPTGTRLVSGAGKPSVEDRVNDGNTYTADFAVTYNRKFGVHGLDLLGLFTVTESIGDLNSDKRINLIAPGLDIINIGATAGEVTSGTRFESARLGYVGRVNYNYDGRYFLEGSFRFDGSTIFAPGNRWGFFPGLSGAWNISKEDFFEPLRSTVDVLKLRASIGLTGDDGIGANSYYYTYGIGNTGRFGSYGYLFGTAYAPTFYLTNGSLPNHNITWAKNRQENIGLEATLWNGKLGFVVDVFQKNRYDILLSNSVSLPQSFGIGAPIRNFAKMRDRGIDFNVSSKHQFNADWKLGINANFTYVRTEHLEQGTSQLPDYERLEGRSVNSILVYQSAGIFQNQTEIDNWHVDQDGLKNKTLKPGDLKFNDLNGDGKLTPQDQYWKENYGYPPLNFGLGFDAHYKNFMLTAFFNAGFGGVIQYGNSTTWDYLYNNTWRVGNEGARYPRKATSTNNSRRNDNNFEKDDFIRLRDLRLSYQIPTEWLKTVKLRTMRVYVQASNLWTWTTVEGGIDPETPNVGTGGVSPGFYPTQKQFGFGASLSF